MDTVILMAKAPFAGEVKTRLSPFLSPEESARVYEGLLLDTASRIRAVPRVRRLLFIPPGAAGYFRSKPFLGFEHRIQRGADLGERMTRAIGAAFSEKSERVAIVGADCPGLSSGRIALALRELRGGADAVFGPAQDGGFYLAGFKSVPRALFGSGVAWSTESVMQTVASRCREHGMAWSLLPVERDIDTPEDLSWLEKKLAAGGLPSSQEMRRRLTD